jgi:hypothetical protein
MLGMPKWELIHPQATYEMLGYIPMFLSNNNPAPAKEQFDAVYQGGWRPMEGFRLSKDRKALHYPGDPPQRAIGKTKLRDEEIILFESSWVAIVQPDNTFEVARMD